MRAGRMSDHQIPVLTQEVFNGLLEVVGGVCFTGEQITRPRIVPVRAEGITNATAVFTGDKDAHHLTGVESARSAVQP